MQTRTVSCYDALRNNATTDCSARTRPARQRSCNLDACPSFSWVYSDWGACSAQCGSGTQTRAVACVEDGGEHVPDSNCKVSQLGSTSQACNTDPCPSMYWQLGAWGACSEACGGGTSTRTVTCMADGSPASDGDCTGSGLTKPDTTRSCNTAPCTVRHARCAELPPPPNPRGGCGLPRG